MLKKSLFLLVSGMMVSVVPGFAYEDLSEQDLAKNMVEQQQPQQTKLENVDIDKVSQAFGNFIGRTLKNPGIGIQFNIDSVIQGIRDGVNNVAPPINEQEYEQAIAALQESAFKNLADKNLQIANDFMAENAKTQGIVVVEPGKLTYEVIKEGEGPAVTENATPLINYTGKFADGTVFGTSEETGPITISLDRTIPGFSKGLIGMKTGEKRRLYIHPDLAYGTKGDLPPNALLVFDVELLKPNATNEEAGSEASTSDKKAKATEEDEEEDEDDEDDDMDSSKKKKSS